MLEWKPMFLAPTDGTPILALYDDFSGVEAIRIFRLADSDDVLFSAAATNLTEALRPTSYAGWTPLPVVPAWSGLGMTVADAQSLDADNRRGIKEAKDYVDKMAKSKNRGGDE